MNQTIAPAADNDKIDPSVEQDSTISFAEIRATLFRQRRIIIPIALLSLAIGLVVSLLMTPIYQAVATVRMEADSNDVVKDGEVEQRVTGNDFQRYLNSQIEVLKSRKMAGRVADQLRLADNNDFLAAMNVEPGAQGGNSRDSKAARRNQVISVLAGNIGVDIGFGSMIPAINFKSPTPATAVRVANAYADNLITGNIAQRYEATSYARDFLEREIARSKAQLEETERQAIRYAEDKQIIDASDGVTTTEGSTSPKSITTANLISSNAAVAGARTARIVAEEKWKQAQQTPLMSLPEVQSNGAIQSLQSARTNQQIVYNELLGRYRKDYPAVLEAKSKVAALDAQISQMAGRVMDSIRNEYQVAQRQEKSLDTVFESLKGDTLDEQNRRVQLNLMARDVDTNRTQYQALLDRYKQVSTASGVVTNNITILDRAEGARKVSPRTFLNICIAGFVGLVLGFAIAFLREIFDDSIRSPDDVSRKLGLPLLGTTPIVDFGNELMAELANRKSPLAESYSSIRSSIDFSTASGAPASLVVTSAQPFEGKTTTSISLAESFARAGRRVLLVDGDLRNPSLHRNLGLNNSHGLVNVLTGNMAFENALQPKTGFNFDLLSSGPIPPNPSEIITSDGIHRLLAAAAGKYDQIIIDGPPTMGLADSPQIARAVEGTIFVVESGGSMRGQTKTAVRRLSHANARILGVVLSKLDTSMAGYGAHYGYQYDYSSRPADA